MLLQILAAAAAAIPAPTATVSPVTVTPQTKPPPADLKIDMQGGTDDLDQMVVIWPGGAYQTRRDGKVTLRCLVDAHGLAERCDVASEEPKGRGFGKAALEMRVTFKLAPTLGPDGPISAMKTIALSFKAPDTDVDYGSQSASMHLDASKITVAHNALELHPVTMLDYPVWAAAANFDDLAKAYPAKGGGAEGYAVAHCKVARDGALSGCQVIKETPEHQDFGKAATVLAAAKFRVIPALAAGRHDAPLWVDVPIRLPPPAALADRTVMAPAWLTTLDPAKTPKLFPPEAATAGLTTGRGVARCTVGADGTMTACAPETGEPDGLGFSEAAAKLASGLKMNLWSADGAPVEGGVVHIPIRLNLKPAG
jgi:hypothetical protein